MLSLLDSLLSRLTMYRLMLYYLIFLIVIAILFSATGVLQGLNPVSISTEAPFFLLTCYLTNLLFSKFFKAPTNFESFAITALILSLIFGPFTPRSFSEVGLLVILSIVAMASKYLLVINRRHIFNPAALAVVVTAVFFHNSASWWIGSPQMLPFLAVGGFLILKKIRRFSLFFVFLIVTALFTLSKAEGLSRSPANLLSPALWFFATVMLIEPQTSPIKTKFQIIYAVFVALLFKFLPLEVSLVLGNIFSYLVEPTSRFVLKPKLKLKLSPDTFAFYFQPDRKLNFAAGQYLELTLSHPHSDSRGTRRFFTIASSPTEPEIMIVSRFNQNGSSFKKTLLSLPAGRQVYTNGPSGEFVLPTNSLIHRSTRVPLVFIAGGIGITPFRSIAKYLIDTGQKRDTTFLYFANSKADFLFKDVFTQACIKTFYIISPVSKEAIKKEIPDLKDRIFYVSGPELMVEKTEEILRSLGVSRFKIKRDYFPGY